MYRDPAEQGRTGCADAVVCVAWKHMRLVRLVRCWGRQGGRTSLSRWTQGKPGRSGAQPIRSGIGGSEGTLPVTLTAIGMILLATWRYRWQAGLNVVNFRTIHRAHHHGVVELNGTPADAYFGVASARSSGALLVRGTVEIVKSGLRRLFRDR